MAQWTTPADIRAALERRWGRGALLAAHVTREPLFPLRLPLRGPKARDITYDFGAVLDWTRALEGGSRTAVGYGYELEYATRRNRVQGDNPLPAAAVVPTETDALRLLRRGRDAERFQRCAEATLERFPELRDWIARRPLRVLDEAESWERILDVLAWFRAHPRPGVYLRQLEIPGVDSKFIEQRRGLLAELLDRVLPPDSIDPSASGSRGFNARYGLASEPPLVRFRILDPRLYIQGLSDLSVTPEAFAGLDLSVERVFITENRINGLAFPDHARSIVIFGLGYGIDRLGDIPWLRDTALAYWGDIDTHGFGILNRLRASFPHVRSLLMDRDTLLAHRPLWGREPADKRYTGQPTRLTADERALFEDLARNRLGERIRLEQERVSFARLRAVLETS